MIIILIYHICGLIADQLLESNTIIYHCEFNVIFINYINIITMECIYIYIHCIIIVQQLCESTTKSFAVVSHMTISVSWWDQIIVVCVCVCACLSPNDAMVILSERWCTECITMLLCIPPPLFSTTQFCCS